MRKHRLLGGLAAALAILVAACGGGGGGADGGIGGTGVALGTITGFGSVFVNGVEFSSDRAVIKLDDRTVAQSDLRVGMVAQVDGSIADARAATITVRSAIKGRVEQVVDANRMIVMGQTVQIDSQTAFDNGVRPVQGDVVEIHGLPVSDGVIAAGYIERKGTLGNPPFAVTGFVASQNTLAGTITIGGLSVAYRNADIGDMPGGSWVGRLVEVKGATCAGNPVCATLTATQVEPAGLQVEDADEAEVEGFVTLISGGGFVIGNQTVRTSANTVYENGTAADLVIGAKVEVEGAISGGVLTATKVEFEDGVRIEANVLTNSAGKLVLQGLDGVSVEVTSNTRLKDLASVGDLVAGNHVRIRGRQTAPNAVVATELELRSIAPDTSIELRGPVSSAASPILTLLGVRIDTSTIADANFRDEEDAVIGRAGFFAALKPGQAVEVDGELNGAVPVWDEAELED